MTRLRDWLSYRAAIDPNTMALVDAIDATELTYGDIDRLTNSLAGRLASGGVTAGDRIGVLVPPGIRFIELIHATMRLGATLVPIDPDRPRTELEGRAECAALDMIICSSETEDVGATLTDDRPVMSIDTGSEGLNTVPTQSTTPIQRHGWEFDEFVCILFTSGTSGEPKAVPLTIQNVLFSSTASAFRLGVQPDDRWVLCLPPYHMGGLAPVFRSTLYGTSVLVQPFETTAIARVIETYDATGISLVPTMLQRLLDADAPLDRLRFVLVGGAPSPPELVERARERNVPIFPTYGMTETASQIATARPAEVVRDPRSVGRPLMFTDVTVVDEDGNPLGTTETGELVIDGPTVMPGYLDGPDANDSTFGPYGFHTRDVGFIGSDGGVRVVGRLDDRILTGGETVHPGSVASVISTHPAVDEVAVIGIDDREWGQRVCALVVPSSERSLTTEELHEFSARRLINYMRPKTIVFTSSLPRTPSGTVDRNAVKEYLAGQMDDTINGC